MFGNGFRSYSRVDAILDCQECLRQHILMIALYSDLRFQKTWDYIKSYVCLYSRSDSDNIKMILLALENRKLDRRSIAKLNEIKTIFQIHG